ncbi:MAG: hypothetical protein Q8P02_00270 [Candidatus Micrarchaeota archaeon]|nr:hypothetical protein [Candidatus Micrarchaeota archaeon]
MADEIPEQTQPQDPTIPEAGGDEEDISQEEEESAKLPFPNARVVKIIKDSLKNEHQIKREARIAANEFLGDILTDVAQTMDQEQYFTLSVEHFNRAARKYREIGLAKKRILRIKKVLEKQRAELDEIIAEIELENP